MKGILEFDLPMEQEEFETAQKGVRYKIALDEVWEKVFRPLNKHGYPCPELQKLVDDVPAVREAIEKLSEIYFQVLGDNEVDLS